jgi:hypothetical protein
MYSFNRISPANASPETARRGNAAIPVPNALRHAPQDAARMYCLTQMSPLLFPCEMHAHLRHRHHPPMTHSLN